MITIFVQWLLLHLPTHPLLPAMNLTSPDKGANITVHDVLASHRSPVHPAKQKHTNPSSIETQVPLFSQVELAHSSKSGKNKTEQLKAVEGLKTILNLEL